MHLLSIKRNAKMHVINFLSHSKNQNKHRSLKSSFTFGATGSRWTPLSTFAKRLIKTGWRAKGKLFFPPILLVNSDWKVASNWLEDGVMWTQCHDTWLSSETVISGFGFDLRTVLKSGSGEHGRRGFPSDLSNETAKTIGWRSSVSSLPRGYPGYDDRYLLLQHE